jgi:hypothetical protein
MRTPFLALALAVGALLAQPAGSSAFDETHHGHNARRRASLRAWHSPYYRYGWNRPLALVVPPTVELQTNYGWGVGGTSVTRIDHQFQRPYPGNVSDWGAGRMMPTPPWPSDTRQLGIYYIRGPW